MSIERMGVVDMSIEDYHGGTGISRSVITRFNKSPYHYWYEYLSGSYEKPAPAEIIKVSDALEFGNAVHTMVLEPEKFDFSYVVWQGKDRRTKAGKEEFIEFKLRNGNKSILNGDAICTIMQIDDAIGRHTDAKMVIKGAERYEQSIFWNDPDTGLLCKVRPDAWGDNYIADFKTSADASPTEFQRSIHKYGYHVQAGMMREALRHACDTDLDIFMFVVVEKTPPYATAVYQLDEFSIQRGVDIFKESIRKMKVCLDSGDYPAYETQAISLPAYAFKDWI